MKNEERIKNIEENALAEKENAEFKKRIIEEVSAKFPLPKTNRWYYSIRENRPYVFVDRYKKHANGEIEKIIVPLFPPFKVFRSNIEVDKNRANTTTILFMNDGVEKKYTFEDGDICSNINSSFHKKLFTEGFKPEPEGFEEFKEYLTSTEFVNKTKILNNIGIRNLNGVRSFVIPNGKIVPENDKYIVNDYDDNIKMPPAIGTVEEWRKSIEFLLTQPRTEAMILTTIACLTGPIILLMSEDNEGLILSGRNSKGKTSSLRLGASVWSTPETGPGVLNSFDATGNYMLERIVRSNGTAFLIDETGMANGRALAHLCFGLSSGTSRGRNDIGGKNKEIKNWKTMSIMSGEVDLKTKIQEDKGHFSLGIDVRFLNIDIKDYSPKIDSRIYREKVLNIINANYGVAGNRFIEYIMSLEDDYIIGLKNKIHESNKKFIKDSDPAESRIVTTYTNLELAAILAVEAGVLPDYNYRKIIRKIFDKTEQNIGDNVDQEMIEDIAMAIVKKKDKTIINIEKINDNDYMKFRNQEQIGYFYEKEGLIYIQSKALLEMVNNQVSKKELLGVLFENDLIKKNGNRFDFTYVHGLKDKFTSIRLKDKIIERIDNEPKEPSIPVKTQEEKVAEEQKANEDLINSFDIYKEPLDDLLENTQIGG